MTDSATNTEASLDGMGLSRHTFIKGVGAMLAASSLFAMGCEGALAAAAPLSDTLLRRSTFARYLGDTFRVYPESGRGLSTRLTGVRDLPATAFMSKSRVTRAYKEACFLIVLRGPGNRPLPQGSYRVEHTRMGRFDLFMVPGATKSRVRYYHAVFNSLLE